MSNEWTISSIGPMEPPTPAMIASGITSAQLTEHNLQAYVELSYIKRGNEVMAGALSDLETALTQTQTSLNSLALLQNLHNQLAPPDATKMPFDFTASNQDVSYLQTVTSFKVYNPADNGDVFNVPISITNNSVFTVANTAAAETITYVVQNNALFTIQNPLDSSEFVNVSWNTATPSGVFTRPGPGVGSETLSITANSISPYIARFTIANSAQPNQTITTEEARSIYIHGTNVGFTDDKIASWGAGSGTARTIGAVIHVDGNMDSYVQAYNKVASSFYGTPLDPIFKVIVPKDGYGLPGSNNPPGAFSAVITSAGQPAFSTYYFKKLQSAKVQISGIIGYLKTLPGASQSQIGLLNSLSTVYAKLPKLTTPRSSFSSIRTWLLDGYNIHGASGVANQGKVQLDITAAITASESLNDSQKESVRNYMFIFEEYYKSAAATLTAISQMIQKMAQNVAR